MTIDTEKKFVLAAMASRTDKAMAVLSQVDDAEGVSRVIAEYIWNVMAILDLMNDDLAGLTSRKLDAILKENKTEK
ncbi:MAG: hypothetical protein J1G30_01240 [Spirochaetales bacterium]|nr:hypothetical protein [Spirochaetales bacterium]